MTIKAKLIAVSIAIIVSSLLNFSLTGYVEHQIVKYQESIEKLLTMQLDVLKLRKYEKDFLAHKDLKHVDQFEKYLLVLKSDIKDEIAFLQSEDMSTELIVKFSSDVDKYHSVFLELVSIEKTIGLTPNDALYGSFRKSAHNLEEKASQGENYKLLSKVLTLRKHEKDFMLRQDKKYLDKFNDKLVKFEECLKNEFEDDVFLKELGLYQQAFMNLSDAQVKRGLDYNSGLIGTMRDVIHKSEESIDLFEKEFLSVTDEYIESLEKTVMTVEIIVILIIIVFVLLLAKSIVNSLSQLEERAKDLAHGEGDLTQRLEIKSSDEISAVSTHINDFIEKVQNTIMQAKETSHENASVAEELARTSLQIGGKAEEESAIVSKVSNQGKDLQTLLTESITNAKATEDELDGAEKTLESANNLIVALADDISVRSHAEAELAERLSSLSSDAQQVKGVLEVIGDIADQTNLLALNAAIEAARAGEHGRGFAVVADEVRKLAERTQKSLSEINATISVIVQSITDASDAISLNATEIEKLSHSANNVQDEISSSVNVMNVTVTKVDEMVQGYVENGKSIQLMIDNIEVVNDLSTENARSVEEIASASDHLSSMTAKLNSLLASYKS